MYGMTKHQKRKAAVSKHRAAIKRGDQLGYSGRMAAAKAAKAATPTMTPYQKRKAALAKYRAVNKFTLRRAGRLGQPPKSGIKRGM